MSLHYETVLVAVDGSDASEKAFKKSIHIVKDNDAKLIVTHVIDSRTFATAEAYDRTLAEREEKNAEKLLNRYLELAKLEGIENVEKRIEYGSPKVKISKDIAKDVQADLIVCGATGLNAVERFLMGSISENIARYASCDVLIVR